MNVAIRRLALPLVALVGLLAAGPAAAVAPPPQLAGGVSQDAGIVRDYYREHRWKRHQFGGLYLLHDPSRLVVMVTDDPPARPYPWEADLTAPERLRFRIADFPERRLLRTYRHLNQAARRDAPWLDGSTGWGVATKQNRVIVYFLSGKAPAGFADHVDMDVILIRKKGYDQPTG